MNTTNINTLHLRAFRGQNLDVTFGDKDTIISGDNGEGKSTTYNALLWLFIGVDADDNTNKNIFDNRTPDDPDNPKTADVEGHLTTNGEPVALRKIAEQKWKYDKSADEPTLVRVADAYRYFINGNEVTATEYKQFIADNFGRADGYLKLMLNPRYWEMLDTRSLRKYFAEIVGKVSEDDIVGDYDEVVLFEIKRCGIEKALTNYRDTRKRVDLLVDKNKGLLADLKAETPNSADIKAIVDEIANIEKEKTELEERRASLTGQNDELIAKRKAEEDAIYAKNEELLLAKVRYENEQAEQERKLVADLETARENNTTLERRRKALAEEVSDLKLRLDTTQILLKELRLRHKDIQMRTFNGTCEVCGNSFIGAARVERLEKFRTKKENDLRKNIEDGLAMKAKEETLKAELAEAETRLANVGSVETKPYADAVVEFRKNRRAWIATEQYANLTAEIAKLEANRTEIPANDEMTQIQLRIGEIDAKLKNLYMELGSKREKNESGTTKIEQLKALIAEHKRESAKARKYEAQVLEYQREYAEIVRRRVNANFKNVQVEMTAPNKSGGLEDVCKLRLEGVADTCNYANRIKIGIEVAQVFQKHFGVCLPLFIDNAESITDIPEHDGQRVMLQVVKGQKLTIKHE